MEVEVVTIDRYGRTVGKIFLDNQNINREMVKAGHAWVYVKYAKDKTLFVLEKNAKENQLGLWALPEGERIPPWQWRKNRRQSLRTTNRQTTLEVSCINMPDRLNSSSDFNLSNLKRKRVISVVCKYNIKKRINFTY